jgi:oxalate decarboxylase
MNAHEYDSILRRISRRNFLRAGSAALAASAAAVALSQEPAKTQTAGPGHSPSDPGPEDKPLFEANPDSNLPPATDHGEVVPVWYSFDLVKKRVEEGGWTHQVTQRELPSSADLAGVNMRLTAGSYRELHWHTADEWAYVLYGKARVTVMSPDGLMFIDDVSEGDLWLFPAGHPHCIQGLDPDGTEFLLVFNQGDFSEDDTMMLSEWLAHTPREILMKNFGLDRAALTTLPNRPLYIFPSKPPINTVNQDQEEIGGNQFASPNPHTFKMKSMAPTKSADGGEVRIVDTANFPLSRHVAAALVTLKPGAMRELHWHPRCSEWQYWIAGQGRMTVFFPVDNARTVDFHANDVGYVPSNAGHYIENTGHTDAIFLEMLPTQKFEDISLNQWLRRLPAETVQAHLGFDKENLIRIPDEKLGIV